MAIRGGEPSETITHHLQPVRDTFVTVEWYHVNAVYGEQRYMAYTARSLEAATEWLNGRYGPHKDTTAIYEIVQIKGKVRTILRSEPK